MLNRSRNIVLLYIVYDNHFKAIIPTQSTSKAMRVLQQEDETKMAVTSFFFLFLK